MASRGIGNLVCGLATFVVLITGASMCSDGDVDPAEIFGVEPGRSYIEAPNGNFVPIDP